MEDGKPIATINPDDLHALSDILSFYKKWTLMNFAPSPKRSQLISQIQMLLMKVSMLHRSKTVVITHDEVECMDYALRVFTQQVRKKIPQSRDRDDILECCEALRTFIITTFSPEQT